jgi:hypothetical protein
MAMFVAVAPIIVLEDVGPVKAMRRSSRLLRPRLFPVLGMALLAGLLSSFASNAVGFVPQMIGLAIGGDRGGWLFTGLGAVLSSLLSAPLIAIFSTLIYFDGRIRQEGFDLELMAAAMEARTPAT